MLNSFVSGVILGRPGNGKTHLARTLTPHNTLLVSAERPFGKSVKKYKGNAIFLDCWQDAKLIAALLGGERKDAYNNRNYTQERVDVAIARFPEFSEWDKKNKIEHIYIDSLTSFSKLCTEHNKNVIYTQNGIDFRSVFSHYNADFMSWITQLLRTERTSIWFSCSSDEKIDEFGNRIVQPIVDGSKIASELISMVDEVFVLSVDENEKRTLITKSHILPAKDRSGQLAETESAHLMGILKKIFNEGKNATKDSNAISES